MSNGDNFQRFSHVPEFNEYTANRPLTSTADVLNAMKDPRYKTDVGYRRAVRLAMEQAAANGVKLGLDQGNQTLESAMVGNSGQIVENLKEQEEGIVALFGNPLYKTSAAYRRQVAEIVAQSNPMHQTDIGQVHRFDAKPEIAGPFKPEGQGGGGGGTPPASASDWV